MYDLIYSGSYKDELKVLFPSAIFKDASDEIHEYRYSIEVEIDKTEYMRIIFLNGFGEISLGFQLWIGELGHEKITTYIREWKEKYPEYFKKE